MNFSSNVLIVGYGAIGRCLVDLLTIISTPINLRQIIIIDKIDYSDRLEEQFKQGLRFFREDLTIENFEQKLLSYTKSGDLIIDVSCNVDSIAMIKFCQKKGLLYINSSIECWASNSELTSLYQRQMNIINIKKEFTSDSPTALLDQGMNPGLISQFVKKALLDVCNQLILPNQKFAHLKKPIEKAIQDNNYAQMAYLSSVHTIHISENDSQDITAFRPDKNTFYNTWSIMAFIDEVKAPAEIGWGSYEKTPPLGSTPFQDGPQNEILLSTYGIDTRIRSWVPSGGFVGISPRHGENFTISNFLTLKINNKLLYRPSVYYVYSPCELALDSLRKLNKGTLFSNYKILTTELTDGKDEVGCLLISPLFGAWWTGSVLSLSEARKTIPSQNATILQVAIGVLAGCVWVLKNPRSGIINPEDLPHEEILSFATPYLGDFISLHADWELLDSLKSYEFSNFTTNVDIIKRRHFKQTEIQKSSLECNIKC